MTYPLIVTLACAGTGVAVCIGIAAAYAVAAFLDRRVLRHLDAGR